MSINYAALVCIIIYHDGIHSAFMMFATQSSLVIFHSLHLNSSFGTLGLFTLFVRGTGYFLYTICSSLRTFHLHRCHLGVCVCLNECVCVNRVCLTSHSSLLYFLSVFNKALSVSAVFLNLCVVIGKQDGWSAVLCMHTFPHNDTNFVFIYKLRVFYIEYVLCLQYTLCEK